MDTWTSGALLIGYVLVCAGAEVLGISIMLTCLALDVINLEASGDV